MPLIDFSAEYTPEQLACFWFYGAPERNPDATWQPPTQGVMNMRRDVSAYLARRPIGFNLQFVKAEEAESAFLSSKDYFGRPDSLEDGSLEDMMMGS